MSTPASAGLSPGPPSRAGLPGLDGSEARLAASLDAAANLAFDRLGRYESAIQIAGHTIRLVFAGKALQSQAMRAFAHIESPLQSQVSFEILVWDTVQSGVPMSPETGAQIESMLAKAHQPGGPALSVTPQGVYVYDAATGRGYHWLPDALDLDETNKAAPVRLALSYAMAELGISAMHAGAVRTASGGFLLCGSSGAGKSTTSIACAQAGFAFAADDFCFVSTANGRILAHSVYASAKVYDHRLADLPQFASLVTNSGALETEKAISFLGESPGFKVIPRMEVDAIVVLASKGNPAPTFRRITPVQALVGLAPSTVLLFRTGGEHLAALRSLVAKVPCFEMHLSRDIEANPPAIESLLRSLGSRQD
jgi:hypothetical protein